MLFPLLTVAAILAQPTPPAAPAASQPKPPAAGQDNSPPAALGRRIAAVRAQTTIAPVLVLVESGYAYQEALAGWHSDKGRVLYPILCDFKTPESRENIARFVRAFKPTRIVRLKGPDDGKLPALSSQETFAQTVYATFGAKDEAGYLAALAARPDAPGPLGAVVTQHGTPGCSAALALAAAYGQVLIFADAPAPPGQPSNFASADKLSNDITAKLKSLNLAYAGMGDQIDAITLCYDSAANVVSGNSDSPSSPIPQFPAQPGESFALTDIIGRDATKERRSRWAYSSQLTGKFSDSVYRAMCAIFLQPTSAAAFNGYERSGEFGNYEPSEAIKALKTAGLQAGFADRPSQSSDDWRQWTSGSFAAPGRYPITMGQPPSGGSLTNDLIFVTTMGNQDFFDLKPGRCYAGDVPFLALPAAVSFTHSWSLRNSGDPNTVGGRWLDRGAYCYVGSVHEPLLSAFVTPAQLAQRLTGGWPIAAAARVQSTDRPFNPFSQAWRVAVLGDALWTLGPALNRTGEFPALKGLTDLDAERAPALKERRWADAFDTFTMLGRDADAAKLARAALNDEPEKIDHAAALRIVMIAYRAGDSQTLIKAAQKLEFAPAGTKGGDPARAPNYAVIDAIWHALWPQLINVRAEEAQLLTKCVRPYSYGTDSNTVAAGLKRTVGAPIAREFFDRQYANCPDSESRKRMDEQKNTIFR